jgi:hypothetical protein
MKLKKNEVIVKFFQIFGIQIQIFEENINYSNTLLLINENRYSNTKYSRKKFTVRKKFFLLNLVYKLQHFLLNFNFQ